MRNVGELYDQRVEDETMALCNVVWARYGYEGAAALRSRADKVNRSTLDCCRGDAITKASRTPPKMHVTHSRGYFISPNTPSGP